MGVFPLIYHTITLSETVMTTKHEIYPSHHYTVLRVSFLNELSENNLLLLLLYSATLPAILTL